MKKVFTLVFFMLLCFMPNCYAEESNIVIESVKEEGKLTMDFSSGGIASYGFSTKLEYDDEKMDLANCTGHNGFDVTYNDNYIVVENVVGSSATKMATCTFNIVEDATMDVKVNDLISSDYTKAVDNGYVNIKLRKGESEIVIENVPNTSAGLTIMYIAFGFIFMLFGGIILLKFMNHKKMAGIVIFMLLLLIPISTYAQRDKSSLSDTDLSNIRKMLLNVKNIDKELDLDGDKNITINDLIITKVDLYALNIDFSVALSKKVAGSINGVYSVLEKGIDVTSTSEITSLKYCIDYKNCEPNKTINISKNVKELSEKVAFSENTSTSKQKICATATNSKGKVRTICDTTGYIIDNSTPSISVKKNTINIESLKDYNMKSNIEADFGYSGGNVHCENQFISTSSDKTTDIYKSYRIMCTAKGNNGKTVSAKYMLNEIDSVVPKITVPSVVPIYNSELPSSYDLRQNATAKFGVKGGIVTCSSEIDVNESDTNIHRTHNVTCKANGYNGKEQSALYKIVEYDNITPFFEVKKTTVDFAANTSSGYNYTDNIANSRFGIKGGNISCTAGSFSNNTNSATNVYRTKEVRCVADGNNGHKYEKTYSIRELDNVVPTISFIKSIVEYDGTLPSSYDYSSNISNVQYGVKGGNVTCTAGGMSYNADLESNIYRTREVRCVATGNNGQSSSSIYSIRELDNTTPTINAMRSEVQFTNTSSENYLLTSNIRDSYGVKGGSVVCMKSGYTFNTNISSTIYRTSNVTCYASGNNGKSNSVSYNLVELDTFDPIFNLSNSIISTTSDISTYDYQSNMSGVRFGAKGGTKTCSLNNVTLGADGSNVYRSGIVKCVARGNNGKQMSQSYTLQEIDNVVPHFTFKASEVTVTNELLTDLTSNIANITYGKKGGNVICEKIPTSSAYAVKCTATGKNGLIFTNSYKMTY